MEKEKTYVDTKSMIASILCAMSVLLIIYVYNAVDGFSIRTFKSDFVEKIALISLILLSIFIPLTFFYSLVKSIKEIPKSRFPAVFVFFVYTCLVGYLISS